MGTVGVVLDTNVVVSALGFGGTPHDALLRACGPDYRIVSSEETMSELARVMEYERLPFTGEERQFYLMVLGREAEFVSPDSTPDVIEADPDDDAFLACADAADAAYLVSGDSHLLELGEYRKTEIVTPAAFLDRTQ